MRVDLLPGTSRAQVARPSESLFSTETFASERTRRGGAESGLELGHHLSSLLGSRKILLPLPDRRHLQSKNYHLGSRALRERRDLLEDDEARVSPRTSPEEATRHPCR